VGAKEKMKLVRSNSPDVVRSIASAGVWASRNWYTLGFASTSTVLALLLALILSFSVSARAAAWVSVPVLLVLYGCVLWRAKVSHQRWVIVECAEQIYVRIFAWNSKDQSSANDPDVLILEASEIASMSARRVEVFLDGPKSRIVEWLVIKPFQAVAEEITGQLRPLLTPFEPYKAILVANEAGRLIVEWRWWRPVLPAFLKQIVRECPSVVIAQEEHSELDLNGIWRGISRNLRKELNAQERQKLVQATRLGFGCDCAGLLGQYKHISFQEAAAYLAEAEREETRTGHDSYTRECVTMPDLHL
jgi:hypothetical protein